MTGEIKLGQNMIAKIDKNKAEIIANSGNKLTIFLDKNKLVASYSNLTLTIEFDKFDVDKLARKIHTIVKSSHKFSILVIQKVLVMLSTDKLYSEILRKLKKVKENEDIELLLKIYNLLNEKE